MKDTIIELFNNKKIKELKNYLNDINESDLAEIFGELPLADVAACIRLIDKDKSVLVFALLDVEVATEVINYLSDKEVVNLINEMPRDDATDILEEMPANIVDKILKKCDRDTRKDINKLLNYKEDSAGSIMTVEYVELKENLKVKDAINELKDKRDEYETINTCYVVDKERKLVGSIDITDLLFEKDSVSIKDITDDDVIFVNTNTDQEEVAAIFQKYDITVMPVVDSENRLVGIITIDDVMDVIEEEATEDIKKMAAIIPIDKPYTKTSVFEIFKARIPWLLLLMVSATFTSQIIQGFEDKLAVYTILTAFIPMLMDTGGNAGGQTSASIIRALSLNDIDFKDVFKVMFKEFRVAILCSIALCGVNFIKMILIDRVSALIALTVCITLGLTLIIAKVIGALLPLGAKKIGIDPAVMASPFITTIVDACSLLVYFSVATFVLNL